MIKKALLLSLFVCSLFADEGMWPLNQTPYEAIEKSYGVQLREEWLDHAQKSCLRVSSGGSASFVSPNGLILTNHHVGRKAIYDVSEDENDLIQSGFVAESLGEELSCPNLYVDQLMEVKDVTEEVMSALTDAMTLEERAQVQKKTFAEIKESAQEATGLQPEIVTLYQGARFHLYLYKRYTDVRLVMAPEDAAAGFGGDVENFEYPRHCLDMAFFRVYDDGKPLSSEHYFTWSPEGPTLGEALFIFGHPGRTERIFTSSHLKFYRDKFYPLVIQLLEKKLACIDTFSQKGVEESRVATQGKAGYENALKVYRARLKGLKQDGIIEKKEKGEEGLLFEGSPWAELDVAFKEASDFIETHFFLEGSGSYLCKLFQWAKYLVRYHTEKEKSNQERLKEYTDAELPTLKLHLLSKEPLNLEYEKAMMIDSLTQIVDSLGENHPAVKIALDGRSPQEQAELWIQETTLDDLKVRKCLFEDSQAFADSKDPLILLAQALDPLARTVREKNEHQFEEVKKKCYREIVHQLFETYGETLYPDATFTLRLSYGKMIGYDDIAPTTNLGGLFAKGESHEWQPPYSLPERWKEKRDFLNETVPYNFISTHDIIGGNSGSPVINAQGEIVGLVFDGNVHSMNWCFDFDETRGRAVSVHSSAILHTLEKIYHASSLVNELIEK